ncbi:50S ribosomal protein L25 [Mesoaciditoga lauensis]|uniref:50S ribosomal protein L25 n=1 Tax=Mesoaciditoga lauensis TaxID=1495039 RepID=UPI000566CE10|nr:50S ribosomal protein L25 [Mesoaciditoga lauensis]
MALTLEAAIRKDGKAKRLLRERLVPGIVYGPDRENIKIQIPEAEITSLLEKARETTPVHLVVKGENDTEELDVFIKSIQRHKLTTKVIHADFYEPEKGKVMHFRIPLKFVGEAAGVKTGGILEEVIRELEIEVLPKDLIEEIAVDVSALEVGDSLRVKDLNIPENMKVLTDLDEVVVGVKAPRAEEVITTEEVEEEVEPEAIKEKTPEEENNE